MNKRVRHRVVDLRVQSVPEDCGHGRVGVIRVVPVGNHGQEEVEAVAEHVWAVLPGVGLGVEQLTAADVIAPERF